MRNVERVAVVRPRHADHQIERGFVELLPSLLQSRHLGEARRIAQAQIHVFVEYLLIDASVIFQHESIVGIGNQQHIEYALGHQIGKLRILEIKLVELYP